MPRRSSSGSYLQKWGLPGRPLFALTGCLALSIAPPARAQVKTDAHKQVEQLVERERCELEAGRRNRSGITPSLAITRRRVPRCCRRN